MYKRSNLALKKCECTQFLNQGSKWPWSFWLNSIPDGSCTLASCLIHPDRWCSGGGGVIQREEGALNFTFDRDVYGSDCQNQVLKYQFGLCKIMQFMKLFLPFFSFSFGGLCDKFLKLLINFSRLALFICTDQTFLKIDSLRPASLIIIPKWNDFTAYAEYFYCVWQRQN